MYDPEPDNPQAYTDTFDATYSRFGRIYDFLVRHTPLWRAWVGPAVPHIRGPRVLEISFGTGWLLTRYAGRFETHGIDLNETMVRIASRNLSAAGLTIPLLRGNVEALPYRSRSFDTVVNTMAFSGYPRADAAMSEICRVLKPDARLVLIDIGRPQDGNWKGRALINLWVKAGDIIRDMGSVLERHGFSYNHESIAGFGSVHLYVAQKQ